MVGYNYTGSNVVFARNRVHEQRGPGPGDAGSDRRDRQPEQLQLERRVAATSGLAIDLDPITRDPNTLGTPNGATINDANDADTGRTACSTFRSSLARCIANGELSMAGFARPGSTIELYVAQADPSGFGEGD